MNAQLLSFVLCSLGLLAPISAQASKSYSNIVVFGDSLSDNGNLRGTPYAPPVPYFDSRFTNGRVWCEQLAKTVGLDPDGIIDRAIGGATTTDILTLQVAPYLASQGGVVDDKALYVVWGGSNDLIALLSNPALDPAVVIQNAMTMLGQSIAALRMAGAQEILVVDLPDIGLTPRVRAIGDPAVSQGATALASAFNQALGQVVAMLEGSLGLDIQELSSFDMIQDITNRPWRYRLWNVTSPAMSPSGYVVSCPGGYLFWDDIHPTRAGHRIVRNWALEALSITLRGDVNGDYRVNYRDARALVRQFGPCPVGSPADLDGDGDVDRKDLMALFRLIRAR